MVLAIKTLFIYSPNSFDTSKLLMLPDPLSNPNFIEEFLVYFPQDEWNQFMASLVSFILILKLYLPACSDHTKHKCILRLYNI